MAGLSPDRRPAGMWLQPSLPDAGYRWPRNWIVDGAFYADAREDQQDLQARALRRLRQSVRLIDDINLDALEATYGGLDSTEHDGVQTLIALARELRLIEGILR